MNARRILAFMLAVIMIMGNTVTASASPSYSVQGNTVETTEAESDEESTEFESETNTTDMSEEESGTAETEDSEVNETETSGEEEADVNETEESKEESVVIESETETNESGETVTEETTLDETETEETTMDETVTEETTEESTMQVEDLDAEEENVVSVASYDELYSYFSGTTSGSNITITINEDVAVTGQIKIPASKKVTLLAEGDVTIKRTDSIIRSLIYVDKNATLTVGEDDEDGMGEGNSFTIDGGAVLTNTGSASYPTLTNDGVTAQQPLFAQAASGKLYIYKNTTLTNSAVYRYASDSADTGVIIRSPGTVVVKDCTITNSAVVKGENSYIDNLPLIMNSGTMTLENVVIEGNYYSNDYNYDQGIISNQLNGSTASTLTINNCMIEAEECPSHAVSIYNAGKCKVYFNGGTLGEGVTNYGRFEMSDGLLKGGLCNYLEGTTAYSESSNRSVAVLSGGTIDGNNSHGSAVSNDGYFKMTGGIVENSYYGIDSKASKVDISGGLIRRKENAIAEEVSGYGIWLAEESSCIVSGDAVIEGFFAGVYMYRNAVLTMNDGTIRNNGICGRGENPGGGVTISGVDARFYLNGGTLTRNSGYDGSGIYVNLDNGDYSNKEELPELKSAVVTIAGGTVTDNVAYDVIDYNISGVTDGSFCIYDKLGIAENSGVSPVAYAEGVTAESVFYGNYVGTRPTEAGGDASDVDSLDSLLAVFADSVVVEEDVTTITVSENVILTGTIVIEEGQKIVLSGGNNAQIVRGENFVNGDLFRVKSGGSLAMNNLTLSGNGYAVRTLQGERYVISNSGKVTAIDSSLIYNELGGTVTIGSGMVLENSVVEVKDAEDNTIASAVTNYGTLEFSSGKIYIKGNAPTGADSYLPVVLNKGADAELDFYKSYTYFSGNYAGKPANERKGAILVNDGGGMFALYTGPYITGVTNAVSEADEIGIYNSGAFNLAYPTLYNLHIGIINDEFANDLGVEHSTIQAGYIEPKKRGIGIVNYGNLYQAGNLRIRGEGEAVFDGSKWDDTSLPALREKMAAIGIENHGMLELYAECSIWNVDNAILQEAGSFTGGADIRYCVDGVIINGGTFEMSGNVLRPIQGCNNWGMKISGDAQVNLNGVVMMSCGIYSSPESGAIYMSGDEASLTVTDALFRSISGFSSPVLHREGTGKVVFSGENKVRQCNYVHVSDDCVLDESYHVVCSGSSQNITGLDTLDISGVSTSSPYGDANLLGDDVTLEDLESTFPVVYYNGRLTCIINEDIRISSPITIDKPFAFMAVDNANIYVESSFAFIVEDGGELTIGSEGTSGNIRFRSEYYYNNGYIANVFEGGTLNIYDGVGMYSSSSNRDYGRHSAFTNSGTVNMYGGVAGGANYNEGNLQIHGGRIERMSDAYLSGAVIENTGNLTMTGGRIEDGEIGILHSSDGELNISGGVITECRHAVKVVDGTMTLSDSAYIIGNVDTGVWLEGGKLVMNGGTIKENGCGSGSHAGVYIVGDESEFVLNDGRITNNYAAYGSGILREGTSPITFNGGSVYNNVVLKNLDQSGDLSGLNDLGFYSDSPDNITFKAGLTVADIFKNNRCGEYERSSLKPHVGTLALLRGAEYDLNIEATDDSIVSYRMEDPTIAQIDENGVVKGKKDGSTILHIYLDGSWKSMCDIYVRDMFIEPVEAVMNRGEETELVVKRRNGGGYVYTEEAYEFTWTVDNSNVVEIETSGNGRAVLKAVGTGNAVVYASCGTEDEYYKTKTTLSIPVTVATRINSINLNKDEMVIAKDDTESLRAFVTPIDANEEYEVTYTSSNPSIAAFEEKGAVVETVSGNMITVKALTEGTATITAVVTVDGEERGRSTCEVRVPAAMEVAEPIYVLTNTCDTLGKVELPEGYAWKEAREGEALRTKLYASDEPQQYAVTYYNEETKVYGETTVDLYIGTITGISVEGDTLLEKGSENRGIVTVKPVYKGLIDESMITCLEPVVSKANMLNVIAVSDSEKTEYYVEALDAACGKTIAVNFKAVIGDGDVTQKKQKGKLWFEKNLKIKVVKDGVHCAETMTLDWSSLSESYVIENVDGIVTLVASDTMKDQTISVPIKITNKAGIDITSQTKLSYGSSNKKTAKVSKDGIITLGTNGMSLITVTAQDGTKKKVQFYIDVRTYKPRMAEDTIVINKALTDAGKSRLYLPGGTQIVKDSLALRLYDKKTKSYTDASDLFVLTLEDNTISLKPAEALTVAYGKSQTYSLVLNAKVIAGDRTIAYEDADGIVFTVKVTNKNPDVKISQSEKLNTFYTDSTARLTVKADGNIVSVQMAENSSYVLQKCEITGNMALLTVGIKESVQDIRTIIKNATFNVELEACKEAVPITHKVQTVNKLPKPVFKSGKAVITSKWNINTAYDVLIDKTTKIPYDLQNMKISVQTSGVTAQKADGLGQVQFTVEDVGLKKVTVSVKDVNWRSAITLTQKIADQEPNAVLSKSTIILNNAQNLTNTTAQESCLQLPCDVYSASIQKISTTDAKTKNAMIKAGLTILKQEDTVLVGLQPVIKSGTVQKLGKGSYSVLVTPQIVVDEGTEPITLKPVKLTIKVVDKEPVVSFKGNTKFDIHDRGGEGVMELTPKTSNMSMDIEHISLSGCYANKFETEYMDGKLIVTPKENAVFLTKNTYSVTPVLTMEDGNKIKGKEILFRPYQSGIKVKSDKTSVTLYRGAWGKENGAEVNLSVVSKNKNIDGYTGVVSVTSLTKGFEYDNESNTLYIENPYELNGGTIKVTLQIMVKGKTYDSKVQKVTLKAKIKD